MYLRSMCFLTFVSYLVLSHTASAFGNDKTWVNGFGQGICEALIKRGSGNEIYVSCDCGAGLNVTSVRFTLGGNSPPGSRIVLTFDSLEPDSVWISNGEISSDCRACAANFEYVLTKIRQHSSVHVLAENGDSARFSLRGSSKAIGECKADFWK